MRLEIIKRLINSDFSEANIDKIFCLLKKELNYDKIYILFFNPSSVTIKYIYPFDENLIESIVNIDEICMKELFNTNNKNFEKLKNALPFINKKNNFIISNLTIKNINFGAVIFEAKHSKGFYINNELLEIISSILSYKIKDKELSDIFKIQLATIQENFIQSKNDYKTIKAQNAKILELDKIKSEFLANITHELRTPLNAIIGFSEMLNSKILGELNSKQEEYIGDIYISGVHLLGMINEILDISKIESNAMTLNKTTFEISRAVDEVINVMTPLAIKKDIILIKKIKNCTINADFQKIKQILYNLLSNAVKFTSKGGSINISDDFDTKNLYITINDTGIGIAKENQEKIFEKFIQLENTYTKTESSTGLGLTITKEFVNLHNGTISVESELNKGATFTVSLPLI